jgi:hypothetical protein
MLQQPLPNLILATNEKFQTTTNRKKNHPVPKECFHSCPKSKPKRLIKLKPTQNDSSSTCNIENKPAKSKMTECEGTTYYALIICYL